MLPIMMLIMKKRGRGKREADLREDGLGINDVVQKQGSKCARKAKVTKKSD